MAKHRKGRGKRHKNRNKFQDYPPPPGGIIGDPDVRGEGYWRTVKKVFKKTKPPVVSLRNMRIVPYSVFVEILKNGGVREPRG